MIYIFKGVQSICSLPGVACQKCGELCGKMHCDPIKECCTNMGSAITHFFQRPLSTFVVISLCVSGYMLYATNTALSAECEFDEGAFLDTDSFCYLEFGVAVLNIIFAFYFQRRVWGKIIDYIRDDPAHKEKLEDVAPPGPSRLEQAKALAGRGGAGNNASPEEVGEVTKVKIHKDTIKAAFWNIFLEDFGVLFYFLVLLANVIVAYMMPACGTKNDDGDFAETADNPVPQVQTCAGGLLGVAVGFTFAYYCCPCCSSAVEIDKKEAETGEWDTEDGAEE